MEQTIFNAVVMGINHDDFVTGIAPKPVQIGAVAYDFFPIEGTIKSYDRAKQVYALYGAEDKINLAIDNCTHGYSDKLREAAVNWFKMHLKGEAPDFITDRNLQALPPKELWCTPTGQVTDRFPKCERVHTLNASFAEKNAPKRRPVKDGKDLKKHIEMTVNELTSFLRLKETGAKFWPRITYSEKGEDFKYENIFYFAEEGIINTAFLIHPLEDVDNKKTFITLLEKGTNDAEDMMPMIRNLTGKGYSLFIVDPRGTGAVKSRDTFKGGNMFNTEYRLGCEAMMLGTSLAAMRAFDILRAYRYLCSRNDIAKDRIGIIAYGAPAQWALMAAVLEPGIKTVILEGMLCSYRSVVDARQYEYDNRLLINGILKHFDIPDLVAALADRDTRLVNLKDAEGNELARDNCLVKHLRACYPAALKTGNISFHQNSDVEKII
jgi:hypothetical protein